MKLRLTMLSLLLSPLFAFAQLYNELPARFPQFEIPVSNNPSPGYYLMSGTYFGSELKEYAIILDTLGQTVFYQEHPNTNYIKGLTLQDNGLLSYSIGNGTDVRYYVMDSTYQVVNTITPVNGYFQDFHDMIIESDDSYWVLAYDVREHDMSQVVPGGSPNAIVSGCLIQHIDKAENLLFEWSSWDHMEITDCDTNFVDLTQNFIDWIHANSLAIDYDGNILLSCRHLNEITKIDVTTGDIIWRWGGKKNQFVFQNPDDIFYGQHTIRYQETTNTYTILDNGNFHSPPHSRGKEFELDQDNRIANCIKVFDHDPVIFINVMGGMQRMDNGSTIVNWTRNNTILTEYDPQGEIIFEIAFVDSMFQSYRIEKYEWSTSLFEYQEDVVNFDNITCGDTVIQQLNVINNQDYEVIINGYNIYNPVFSFETEMPVVLAPNSSETVSIGFFSPIHQNYEGILSLFHSTDTSRIAQQVRLNATTIVGMNDISASSHDVAIFPNPARDHITIEMPPEVEANSIEIYDLQGKRVVHEKVSGHSHSLDVEHLPKGLYITRIITNKGVKTEKLLIQ